jgi:hypothetical protein
MHLRIKFSVSVRWADGWEGGVVCVLFEQQQQQQHSNKRSDRCELEGFEEEKNCERTAIVVVVVVVVV